ncbi:hypothetical protein [Bosea sp. (in: a-proteobacteria)]|uniref:hypothetical protein n=1 Tax=Bosea sp. (in: a-proteobacteria) TaxID=1871050 RepID=UPI000BDBE9B8|nr:MAG: hypothetical protein B7Z40_16685 [Bosea sp. 12-68-7]
MDRLTLNYVWKQELVPVILRRTGEGEKHRVRLPFKEGNRAWLQTIGKSKPVWFGDKESYWEIPKSWFNDFVEEALRRYGKVYIIQPFREQEKCSSSCQNAVGHECQCSCMGEHHGAGNDGSWFEVSDAFSTRWKKRELACRLLTATS